MESSKGEPRRSEIKRRSIAGLTCRRYHTYLFLTYQLSQWSVVWYSAPTHNIRLSSSEMLSTWSIPRYRSYLERRDLSLNVITQQTTSLFCRSCLPADQNLYGAWFVPPPHICFPASRPHPPYPHTLIMSYWTDTHY